ncbi:hypothetical protein HMPREF3110_04100 [Staphylococcus sp. HMSC10C03]|uniref:ATP-binding cassette domain-containing protein n=1 Tax=Staphylococcus sp. HMSC10C03 TaxID=1581078 RepID=UPI0008D8D03B|nr:ATP-binding cassette domain-containing protein [Staphylococcus sp. HMSC10C03]OFU79536.1 hypothetical protein HMPREF3110_04100 [Staphylococcus sp. HMSC10C03]
MIAKVEHLSKSFGDVEVIKDISFELETGKIHAILGPNGSGRTSMKYDKLWLSKMMGLYMKI